MKCSIGDVIRLLGLGEYNNNIKTQTCLYCGITSVSTNSTSAVLQLRFVVNNI